jgi:hypothetical protein
MMLPRLLLEPDPAGTAAGLTANLQGLDPAALQQLAALIGQAKSATTAAGETKPAGETKAAPNGQAQNTAADPTTDIRTWLKRLEDKVNERDRAERTKAEETERSKVVGEVRELLDKGDLRNLQEALGRLEGFFTSKLGERDSAVKEIEGRYHRSLLTSALAEATAGTVWTNAEAGRDALAKLAGLFEVAADGQGGAAVRAKGSALPVAQAVAQALQSEGFGHFIAAGDRGKGGLGGGDRPAPTGQSFAAQAGPANVFAPNYDLVGAIKNKIAWQQGQQQAAGLQPQGFGWGHPAPNKK